MKKLKLYLETSVWNFIFAVDAPEHQKATKHLFQQIADDKFGIYISRLVLDEINRCSRPKQDTLLNLIKKFKPLLLEPSGEVSELANEYITRGIIPSKYQPDALHIAYTVVANLDILVSWNFAHLVKSKTRREATAVNLLVGYKPVEICSPEEVIIYEI